MKRIGLMMGSILAATVATALINPPAAYAHDRYEVLWTNSNTIIRAKGNVTTNHTKITVCDMNDDGLGVRIHYWTDANGYDIVGDANGYPEPCGSEFAYDRGHVTSWKICAGKNGADTYCTPVYAA
ncbi:hypothetical protein [Nonomuraea jiangxiensis]|uniref:Secreted protein n=1 Tax=Nonomuraea jiangxiensis TaxID=633440 RepID=A0A1G9AUE3_9ACTN|nr:hypothetical protein [Nonomuraea jiangxiensis]SDK30524.1 hypothetical protein SAMN05421869_11547 [Nonomuraea jiangxiensis]